MARYIFLQYVDESKAPRPGSPELHAQIEAFAKYLEHLEAIVKQGRARPGA